MSRYSELEKYEGHTSLLMMASLVVAIIYYQLGHAPPQEPISGYFGVNRGNPRYGETD